MRPTTRPLLLGNLRPPQLQHLVKPPYLPLHRLYRHSANLHQIPQHLVNQRRHLVSLPPPLLPLARMPQIVHSVNPRLPLVRERQLNSRPLAEAYHLYHQADPLVETSPMQSLLPPILQMRSRRTSQAQIRTMLYSHPTIPHCCPTTYALPSRPHDSLGITSPIGSRR